jgi:hypothetical protein
MAVKPLRRTAARQDETYGKIVQAFLNLLHEQGGVISKEDVLKEAQATAWASLVRWAYVIDFVTKENPGVVILCLTWRFFASPRNKKAHSVEPSKYVARNYTAASGFASVAQFVEGGERNRDIALAKFSQEQIAAARAVEGARRFGAMIPTAISAPSQPALL